MPSRLALGRADRARAFGMLRRMGELELDQIRLLVDDVPSCRDFYRDVLDIPVVFETPVYAKLQNARVSIGIYRRGEMALALPEPLAAHGDAAVIVFRVDDVDEVIDELQRRGAEPIDEPTDQPTWGLRAVHFRDPAGNLIELISGL